MKRGVLVTIVLLVVGCAGGVLFGLDPSWAMSSGGTGTDRGWGVAASGDYSGVTVGDFTGTTTLGPGQAMETTLTSLGDADMFVLHHRFDSEIDWVRHIGSVAPVVPRGVTRYSDGSCIVIGAFQATVTVGVGRPDATNLTSAGEADIFVARYDADGSLAWVKRAGGAGYDEPRGVDSVPDGSCVVNGYFKSATITFGPGEANETQLTSAAGQTEAFTARYNADGTLAWAKRAGGTATCTGNDIAAFADGSSIAATRIEGTSVFGAGEANETELVSLGATDFAVARYNPDGTLAWVKRAGGTEGDTPWGVDTYADGSCAVSGNITGTATFGDGEANETELTAVGEWDILVARFNADGTLRWARTAGGAQQEVARDLISFADGACAITGRFRDVATFGAGEPNETVLTSNGEQDLFVARYHGDGTLDWAESVGGTGSDQGEGLAALPDGSFLLVGRFESTVTFHAGDRDETTLVSAGDFDLFVARYLAAGG